MKILMGGTPYSRIEHVGIAAYRKHFGMLCTWADGAHPRHADFCGVPWAADNFAFSGFDPIAFQRSLIAWQEWRDTCLWVAVPDVVGDAVQTWERFQEWEGCIQALGYSLALVAQDGLEDMDIQWSRFKALFIGGSTEWKLSDTAALIIREAKKRGKWVHMGRVNSIARLKYAMTLECDSVDGSGYARFPIKALEHLPQISSVHPLTQPMEFADDYRTIPIRYRSR